MTAEEARILQKGSMKHKGLWFKARLAWMCGRLNSRIESNAEHGLASASLTIDSESVAEQYFPLMAQMYEAQGYLVVYGIKYAPDRRFRVFWNFESLNGYKRKEYYDSGEYRSAKITELVKGVRS